MVAPVYQAGNTIEFSAFPWKSGMAEYRTSSGENGTRTADFAARPCENRTALGAPVDPDVKISRYRSSGAGRWVGEGRALVAGQQVLVARRVGLEDPPVVDAEVAWGSIPSR